MYEQAKRKKALAANDGVDSNDVKFHGDGC